LKVTKKLHLEKIKKFIAKAKEDIAAESEETEQSDSKERVFQVGDLVLVETFGPLGARFGV